MTKCRVKFQSKCAAMKQIGVVEKLDLSSAALAFCLLLVTPKTNFGSLHNFIIRRLEPILLCNVSWHPSKLQDSHYFRDIPVFDEARALKSWAPMCDSNGSLYKLN